MRIGVPREIKADENRVGLLPSGAEALRHAGHSVLIETQAGACIGFSDKDYKEAGATVVTSLEEVYARGEMIVKVKEPMEAEWLHLRAGQIVFTSFHFAASEPLFQACVESGAICIAYETVGTETGDLPLLAAMRDAVPSAFALTNATLPYVLSLAGKGWKSALNDDAALRRGLNIARGKVTFAPLATEFGVPLTAPETLLA